MSNPKPEVIAVNVLAAQSDERRTWKAWLATLPYNPERDFYWIGRYKVTAHVLFEMHETLLQKRVNDHMRGRVPPSWADVVTTMVEGALLVRRDEVPRR